LTKSLKNKPVKNKIYLLFLILVQQITAQNTIIPAPVSYQVNHSDFIIDNQTTIINKYANKQVTVYINLFQKFLNNAGFKTEIKTNNISSASNSIIVSQLKKYDKTLGSEGYLLSITKYKINISANKPEGIFNGFQSLEQLIKTALLKSNQKNKIKITGCQIKDYPRFAWRGLMLDVSRHFFTVDEVKAYIDKMSQYKFNTFHWHLTDDQGWRIEIKSLPKLTQVGAWRVKRYGRFGKARPYPKKGEKSVYGGFYTQEQIKDVVRFASDRNVTIVPEIDVPGHSMAALAAYPELSTKKEPKFVVPGSKFSEWYGGGKFKMTIENTLNPADENIYKFLDKVFTEVASLFPGKYIHMGGDEAYHGYWKNDASVQKFMKKKHLKSEKELQSYFVKRVEKIIRSKGKKLIGWDEILEDGLTKGAAVMSWRGMKGGIEAAKMKHKVVMTPATYAYLDYTQGDYSVENKIYASLSLEKAYRFEPVPSNVKPKYILGGQGNLWTEAVPTLPFAFYMTYPRAFAIAETLWSPKNKKDWNSFISRVENQFVLFDAESINISKAVYDPSVKVYKKGDSLMCQLKNNIPNSQIYYTIDNTYPVQFGKKYTNDFQIPKGDLYLRTQTFRNGKPISRTLIISRKDLVKRIGK
jgi:hexosaminidase